MSSAGEAAIQATGRIPSDNDDDDDDDGDGDGDGDGPAEFQDRTRPKREHQAHPGNEEVEIDQAREEFPRERDQMSNPLSADSEEHAESQDEGGKKRRSARDPTTRYDAGLGGHRSSSSRVRPRRPGRSDCDEADNVLPDDDADNLMLPDMRGNPGWHRQASSLFCPDGFWFNPVGGYCDYPDPDYCPQELVCSQFRKVEL
ncbi:unnamed protein product [Darwinula stevensoni]|uniref:Uncharacterized protein n=1 Tax=Darwinula stevensoni TaxID=69355 RepID=A0A7R8XHE8_9CRUS|nr:unnamed protein product [Darwinula stevensoni]CAG0892695.1 unnamed protein product [Darwinula stevensoni]